VQSNIKGLIAPWPHKFENLDRIWSVTQGLFISAFSHTADN